MVCDYINLDGNSGNPPTSTWIYNVSNGTKIDLTGYAVVTDRNGNEITASSDGTGGTKWTDTTGRVAEDISFTGANPTSYNYTDPNNSAQAFTLKWKNYSIMTNFGCAGISEYNSTGSMPQVSLPYELDLPNGQKYSFAYEGTPGHSGYFTGRIATITLPTSGVYTYTYGSTNDGINCADATIDSVTRTISGTGITTAIWTYQRVGSIPSGYTTTVTAPLMPWDLVANQYVYTFNSLGQQTEEQDYQGSAASGTVVKTINTAWATNGSPSTRITILPTTSGTAKSEVATTYDGNGHLQQMQEYDWGSGAVGSLIRVTNFTFSSISAPFPFQVLSEKTLLNSSSVVSWREDVGYDGTTPTCVTGVSQHDNTNFGCSYNTRGNPTSLTTYTNPAGPSGAVVKAFTYDVFGNLLTAQVNCCQSKQFNFSSITNYAYPDTVVSGPATGTQLTESYTYYPSSGQIKTYSDANGQQYSYTYDLMKRPTTTTRPDTAQLKTTYNDTALTITGKVPVDASGKQIQNVTQYDAIGRPSTITTEDVSGTPYSTVLTKYDPAGRAFQVSNPYTGSPNYCTTGTWFCTQTNFDALGRPESSILQDLTTSTITYSGNCATSSDQASKARESCSDGSGRLTKVYEDPSGLNYETDYAYNVLDELSNVSQGSGSQSRAYVYDGMGRLTSSTTPEGGNAQFQYNSFDMVTQRTDARGVITAYGYDTLNRLKTVTYNVTGATGVPATTGPSFTYDTGGAPAFAVGRVTKMTDAVGSESYSYDLLGRITSLAKVINGATYPMSYGYNYLSELVSVTYPSGRIVDQSYDAIGRLCAVAPSSTNTCSLSTYYSQGYLYNPAQQVTTFNFGNGVVANFGYTPTRMELSSMSYANGSTTLFGVTYGYTTGQANNGQITNITDTVDGGRSLNYVYDSLYRIKSAVTNGDTSYPQWGLSWTYDVFGNRLTQSITAGCTGIACPTNSLSVTASTNRISGTGFSYDANGNMTGDGVNTIIYDGENRALNSTGISGTGSYAYDGNNLRIQKCVTTCASASTVYVYSGSRVIAEYDNGAGVNAPSREYIYSGAALLATLNSSGTNYHLRDHRAIRVTTNSSGTIAGQQGNLPFGEQWYAANTVTKWVFDSYERDSESTNDYARARSYVNRLGRFASPDLRAGNVSDPQTLDRYSYARNEPVSLSDPSGMATCQDGVYSAAVHHYVRRVQGSGHSDFKENDQSQDDIPCDPLIDDTGGTLDPSVPPPPPPDQQYDPNAIHVYTYEPDDPDDYPYYGVTDDPLGTTGTSDGTGGDNGGLARQIASGIGNFFRILLCAITEPLQNMATANQGVLGIGVSASAGGGFGPGANFSMTAEFVASPSGEIGFAYTEGTGMVALGAGANAGVAFTNSRAQTFSQFSGFSSDISIGAGPGVYTFSKSDINPNITSRTLVIGPGVGLKLAAGSGTSKTSVPISFSCF